MPLITTCPQCQQKYSLRDDFAGRQVQCPKCSTTFLAPVAVNPFQELTPLGPSEFSDLPPAPVQPGGYYQPNGTWAAAGGGQPTGDAGPSDTKFRLAGAGMVGVGLFLAALMFLMHVYANQVYLLPLVLIPVALIMGATAVIAPDIVRSIGKWGKHLPWHYKAIGGGLMALSLVLGLLLVVMVFTVGGYRPG